MATKKPKLGSGKRFEEVEKNAKKSGAKNPAAVAAAAGIKNTASVKWRRWPKKVRSKLLFKSNLGKEYKCQTIQQLPQ